MTLRICVILAEGRPAGPGERRFLDMIAADARFELACVTAAPPPAPALPRPVAATLAAEGRAFPAPDRAPGDVPPAVALETAAARGCDVAVDFSHGPAALRLAEVAVHGLWRLSAFAGAAGLAEARDRAPVTRVTIWRHANGKPPVPLAGAAYDTKFLATRNRAFMREKSVQLAVRELARLSRGEAHPGAAPAAAPRGFGTADLPGYLFRTARELAARSVRAASEKLGRRPGMFHLRVGAGDGRDFDPARATDLVPGGNTFWADPFLFLHEDVLYLFYEDYDYTTRRGHLGVGRLDGMRFTPLGRALERPHHLSFPFVFRWRDEILMIPETHAAGRVEVWRATAFPLEWELAATALEGVAAVDTVVVEHDGQWWMFTNICRDSFGDFCSELHLYRVDGPMLRTVEPHPLNPVVIDAQSARAGGRVFAADGRLYRASQDNSHGIYGYGLNLMEITELSPARYAERRVRHVTPDFMPGIMGCHHLDAAGGRFVVDVRRRYIGA